MGRCQRIALGEERQANDDSSVAGFRAKFFYGRKNAIRYWRSPVEKAIDKAQDTIARRRKGLDSTAAQTPLTDFLKRFLEFYKTEGGVSLRTWQDYRYHNRSERDSPHRRRPCR